MGNNTGKPPIGPVFQRIGPTSGINAPPAPVPVSALDKSIMDVRPLSGGLLDAQRSRIIKGYFTSLAPENVIYEDRTMEIDYNVILNQRFQIYSYNVPQSRTLIIDNIYFFATSQFGNGLIPGGLIEGSVQCFFDVGQAVPVQVGTQRDQLNVPADMRAYFPFLNDRVGARQNTFAMYVKSGRQVGAYYINLAFPFIPVATIGVRFEGWVMDSNIFEEILQQQR